MVVKSSSRAMHPMLAFHFLKDDCLVVPFATGGVLPRLSWSRSVLIVQSEDAKTVGKMVRQAMEAASLLVSKPIDTHDSKEWRSRYSEHFNSPMYGSMELKDKRWTIYCGNDCSPQLETVLPAVPSDEAAGLAYFELREELLRLDGQAASRSGCIRPSGDSLDR